MKSYLLSGRASSYGATKRRDQYLRLSPMIKSSEKRNQYINQFQINSSLEEENRMLGEKLSEMISENRRLRQKSYHRKTQAQTHTDKFSEGLKNGKMKYEIQDDEINNRKQKISEQWLRDQTRRIEESLNQREQKYIKNRQKRANDALMCKGYSYLNQKKNLNMQIIGTKKNSVYSGLYQNSQKSRQKCYNKQNKQNKLIREKQSSPIHQQKPQIKLSKQCYFNSVSEKSNSINLSKEQLQEKQEKESIKIIKKKQKNKSLKNIGSAANFICEVYLQQETILCEPSNDEAKVFEEESFGGTPKKQLSPVATPTNKELENRKQVNLQPIIFQSIKSSNGFTPPKKEKEEKKHFIFNNKECDQPKISTTPSKFQFKKSNQPYVDTSDYKLNEPKTQLKWSPFHSIKQNFASSPSYQKQNYSYQKQNYNILFAKSGNYNESVHNHINARPAARRTYISVISKSLQKCR